MQVLVVTELHSLFVQNHIYFPGRVDGKFIPKPVVELLTEKAVAAVPFIIGVNNHEFGYIIPMVRR